MGARLGLGLRLGAGALALFVASSLGLQAANMVATFDGVDDVLIARGSQTLTNTSFTLMGWARKTVNGHGYFICQGARIDGKMIGLGYYPDNRMALVFHGGGIGNDLTSPEVYTDFNWHHMAATFDVTTRARTLYRDGVLVASNTSPVIPAVTGPITIGALYSSLDGPFHLPFEGSVDEIRIFTRVLNAAEINAAMLNEPFNTTGQIEYWRFDHDDATKYLSEIPNGHPLIKGHGAVSVLDDFATPNKAATFDGVDDYMMARDETHFASSFTISAWARKTANGRWQWILYSGTPGLSQVVGFGFRGDDRFTLAFGLNNDLITGGHGDLEWHHWAGTFNADTRVRKIYRDGIMIATDVSPVVPIVRGPMAIGARKGVTDASPIEYWKGDIDEVKLWERELSAEEVQQEAAVGVRNSEAIVQYWNFEVRESFYYPSAIEGGLPLTQENSAFASGFSTSNEFVRLDGGNDYFDMSGGAGTNFFRNKSFTIATWARKRAHGRDQYLVTHGEYNIQHRGLHFGFRSNNQFTLGFWSNDINVNSPVDYEWHHYVGTYNAENNERRLYIDGIDVANDFATADFQGQGPLGIGAIYMTGGGPGNFFLGDMDEVKIWGRALSANEVAQEYGPGVQNPAELLAYWNFDNLDKINNIEPSGVEGGPRLTARNQTWDVYDPSSYWQTDYFPYVAAQSLTRPFENRNHIGHFDGASYFETSATNYFSSNSFTITAWGKKTVNGRYQWILRTGGLQANDFYFGFQNNDQFAFGFGGTTPLETPGFGDFHWHHWAASYNASTKERKIYRDGILVATNTGNNAVIPAPLVIGTRKLVGDTGPIRGDQWYGGMDEIKIWQRTLSVDEIRAEMPMGVTATEGLVSYWNFERPLPTADGIPNQVPGGLHLMSRDSATARIDDLFDKKGTTLAEANFRSANHVAMLDGLNDSLVPSVAGTNFFKNQSFSFSVWARKSENGTYQMLLTQGDAATHRGLHIGFRDNNVFTLGFFANDLDAPALTDFNWHHWAGTYNATNRARMIYRDGSMIASNTASANYQGEGRITIGYQQLTGQSPTRHFSGAIDEFKLWQRALSVEELRAEAGRGVANPASLIAYWDFEAFNLTNITSSVQGGFDLARGNGAAIGREDVGPRNYNNALSFNGSQQWGTVVNPSYDKLDNKSFTVSVWARRGDLNTQRYLVNVTEAGVAERTLYFGYRNNNSFTFAFHDDDLDTPSYTDLDWHYWTGTFDATTKQRRIYRDGVLVAEDIAKSALQATGYIRVAHRGGGGVEADAWFYGDMDELRIYKRPLTQAEIVGEATRFGYTGLTNDLLDGWSMDHRGNSEVYNMVPGGAEMSLGGGPRVLRQNPIVMAPSFDPVPDMSIDEDAGPQTIPITGIYDNAPDRLTPMQFSASASNPALLGNFQSTYDGTGPTAVLTMKTPPHANGSAVISLELNAPPYYGVLPFHGSQTFNLTITSINDLPIAGTPTSLRLHGNDSVTLPGVAGLPTGNQPNTISVWVRPVASVTAPVDLLQLGEAHPGALEWTLEPSADPNRPNLKISIRGNSIDQIVLPGLAVGAWSHIAVSWNGTVLKVYLNGIAAGEVTPASANGLVNLRGVSLTLGKRADSPNAGFNGNLDELQIWNRGLTATEIVRNLNTPLAGTEPGLFLYWRFDEGENMLVTDTAAIAGSKGAYSHGTLNGGAGHEAVKPPSFGKVTLDEDSTSPVYIPGFDVEGPITYTITAGPLHGTINRTSGVWNNFNHNPIQYTPAPDYNGPDRIRYKLSDGIVETAEVEIPIEVVSLNDNPTLSFIANQSLDESEGRMDIPFIVTDAETPLSTLNLTALSSDQKLLPNANLILSGTGTNRTLIIRAEPGELGRGTITLTVTDADGATASRVFDIQIVRHLFAIVDLGTLPNRSASFATALNDNGWVVGYSQSSPNDTRAFLYQGLDGEGALVDLGTLGGQTSAAYGINNNNLIAGASLLANRTEHAFIFGQDGNVIADLGVLTGGTTTRATALNLFGDIAGFGGTASGPRAFVRLSGTSSLTTLNTLGGTNASATAINDFGVIVGSSKTTNGAERAFRLTGQTLVDLGTLPNHLGSRAWGISSSGQIVGESISNNLSIAFSFANDAMTSLGTLAEGGNSAAYGVNDSGQVVGTALWTNGQPRAFLHSAGKLMDLNSLVSDDTGWVLTEARAINKGGMIAGTGLLNGRPRAFLAVPATPIGRPVARPQGTALSVVPQADVLKGPDSTDNGLNSYLWVGLEQRLYAIRPVVARIKWPVSASLADTNRITSYTINVWPRSAQVYVAESPVEVEPKGVPFNYAFQSMLYSTTPDAMVDPTTKTFRSGSTGFSVLYYLRNNGALADVQTQHPYFEVLRRVAWNDPAHLQDRVPWTVGEPITHEAHTDYGKKNGYAFFMRGPYDGAGNDKAYDRITRLGPIIPVNLDSSATDDDMVVVWYRTNLIGVAWASEPVRYSLSWPTNAPHIVTASGIGSGDLPFSLYPDKKVYSQPDPTLPGYNPNEEHALIASGFSGEALFALRNDLNTVIGVSEPFALLKYKHPALKEWRIKVFQALAEEAPYFFNYPGEAGLQIQPPFPMSILTICDQSEGVFGPYWEDVRGRIYARAAGEYGGTTNIIAHWFYPLQPTFFYDLDLDGQADQPAGACVPLLDRLPGGTVGVPANVNYEIHWPDAPTMQVGETLINPKRGLPGVKLMARVQIIYDDLDPQQQNPLKGAARLYDPLSTRTYKLAATDTVPQTIARQNIAGKEVFTDLPFGLRMRLKYDPLNRWLHFSGFIDESGVGSNPLLLPNIMTQREREKIKALAFGNTTWAGIIDKLYAITRNPNALDLDGNGSPDEALLVGLKQQTIAVTNFVEQIRRVGGLLVTNRVAQVVSTNVSILEELGDLPKGLSAGLTGVPPAQPRPGLALRFDGNDVVTSPALSTLGDFTIAAWIKSDFANEGYLFKDTAGEFYVKFNVPQNKITVADGLLARDIDYNFDSNWHFVALTRNQLLGKLRLSIDGFQAGDDMPASLTAFNGTLRVGEAFRGEMDEFQIWEVNLGGNQILSSMSKRLLGGEDGLILNWRYDESEGSSALDTTLFFNTGTISGAARVASTAPAGIPPRYLTLVENNDLSLGFLPIGLKIIRVEDGPYLGDVKLIYPDNAFDERLTLRHSGDFLGAPEALEFEWYYKADAAGFDPTDLPRVNADGSVLDLRGWNRFPTDPASGQAVVDITLGERGESGLLLLGDNWFVCRYRGFPVGLRPAHLWTDWVGDPASAGTTRAALAEGWVKRVIRGLNPFDSRSKDFHSAEVNTYASMLVQAGQRYEGDIAFNPAADAINSIGLIEAYTTVLQRGKKLSIDSVPPVDFDAANNALLLAASKISDLYTLIGNEAYADAQDPTIGFSTSDGKVGNLASSLFAFQNQLDSALQEELVLLRGRDDSSAGVGAAPIYNRLFWNFTLGEGEVAYQQTYAVSDQNKDGFVDEKDARILFPQGHGDAWGHYLTASKMYYDLLRHPHYQWKPRTEAVVVAGASVEVDFLDERKFAHTAALKAKTGAEIVSLTYRLNYVDDPAGQWQGYKDTEVERGWGVDEWARRAGQAALFDWAVANSLLPSEDTVHEPGLQKIDRTTVTELTEIAPQFDNIQRVMDQADAGLNPLGLAKGVVPFDVDPLEVDGGHTHFEQILDRAIKAMNNAVTVWNEANQAGNFLRKNQDSVEKYTENVKGQERDFKNRLIEIFGYPYAGDIGPGKTFPSGYDGPDLYHYMYINTSDLSGDTLPPADSFKGYFKQANFGIDTKGHFFPEDVAKAKGEQLTQPLLQLEMPKTAADYGFRAPPEWGQRRASGELQLALSEMVQQNARLKQALDNYDNLMSKIKDQRDLLQARYDLRDTDLTIKDRLGAQESTLGGIITAANAVADYTASTVEDIRGFNEAIIEGMPRVAGLANDVTSGARAAVKGAVMAGTKGLKIAGYVAKGVAIGAQAALDNERGKAEVAIDKAQFAFEMQQPIKELEQMLREEGPARAEVFQIREILRQSTSRYEAALAKGQRLIEERVAFRQKAAGDTTKSRYNDMTFRIFRNDALQKYRAQFDMAARYVYLAATAYDYEANLLGTDNRAGRGFLTEIIRQRSLGQMNNGLPVAGRPGMADSLARMSQNFDVLKTQLGFNNPQTETGRFSLRNELFRMGSSSAASWAEELKKHRVADLWAIPEFRRYCRPFAPESAGPQPGLVIRFPTTVSFGRNFFGWPLSGGDSAYDPSRFATKIRSVGVWFSGYNGAGLSLTPRVYLAPIGADVLRSPTGDGQQTREWTVVDQVLPVPFTIGASSLKNPSWTPNDALGGNYADIRRFAGLRAFHDSGNFSQSEAIADSRLIGRSVWNREWMLVIPGGTFLADQNAGLDVFINTVSDIKLFFQTYSYAGN